MLFTKKTSSRILTYFLKNSMAKKERNHHCLIETQIKVFEKTKY
jgi:hypothetical protein